MEDRRITAEEILAEIDTDVKQRIQRVADAVDSAQAGAIIDQSGEQILEHKKGIRIIRQKGFSRTAEGGLLHSLTLLLSPFH